MAKEQESGEVRTIEPCAHMETWVNGLSDGSLKGVKRAYTRFHIAGCSKCRAALQALDSLHLRLESLDSQGTTTETIPLTPERRAALDAAMEAVDRKYDK